jgi:hypothetical protein
VSAVTHPIPGPIAAVVWIDHWHALVARRQLGRQAIVDLERAAEPEAAYVRRVAEAARDCGRLMILGPDDERLELGREYRSIHGEADSFVEVEAAPSTTFAQLLDRLRLLEGDELAGPVG